MIAKKFRVPKNLIPYILKKGNEATSQLFIVRKKENSRPFSRYRIIVSSKVASKAVDRNKLRRRIYEAIRSHIPTEQPSREGKYADRILIAKKKIIDYTFQELEKDLKNNIISYN